MRKDQGNHCVTTICLDWILTDPVALPEVYASIPHIATNLAVYNNTNLFSHMSVGEKSKLLLLVSLFWVSQGPSQAFSCQTSPHEFWEEFPSKSIQVLAEPSSL